MAENESTSLKWSGHYKINSQRSKQLPGDKILLPPSALEQLLAASSDLAAEIARRDLPPYDPLNSASFSAYRHSEAQYQDARHSLPYPLTFRLVNPQNGRVVYAGIREFSAEDEEAVLSPFLLEALGLPHGDHNEESSTNETEPPSGFAGTTITIHVRQLPKGTFVKLRPLEAGYDPEDWKALLEHHLRQNYTTLTNGEILAVHAAQGTGRRKEEYRFLVDGFKPETEGVCIVDTDLEVDIEPLNEAQARETVKQIAEKMAKSNGNHGGRSTGGQLDLFKEQEGSVMPGDYADYELSSWDRTQAIEVDLDVLEGDDEDMDMDLDLLISPVAPTQRAKPRLEEHIFADLTSDRRKRIRLEPTNVALDNAEALYVSVHAYAQSTTKVDTRFEGARHFTLRVTHPQAGPSSQHNTDSATETSGAPGDVRCQNCGQWVPERTLMLHENFCLRNNKLCPKGCGQVFQKSSPAFQNHWHCPHDAAFGNSIMSREKHNHIFHPPHVLRCDDCATLETFPSLPMLARHRTSTCPAKQILCRFCHLVVPQEGDPDSPDPEALLSDMTPHELADGARTTECHICSRIVRLRDMSTHLKSHDLDRLTRPPPRPCRNVNCARTLDTCSRSGDTRAGTRVGQGPGNNVSLCNVCFGPLYVSMYDPENKALRRRVERRYLQQLLTGCGRDWCKNEFCKSGRRSLGMETNVTTKDALPMIKPMLGGLLTSQDTPLHFCADESSQRRRTLAEMLAAEVTGPTGKDGYTFEWCLGALEAEAGDIDAARLWLKNWAPARQEELNRR